MARSLDSSVLSRRLALWAFWLGFALSGFFDGILLHQILQWHHLLSGLEPRGAPFADLRFQVLADGYFHLLMYVLAGLALLGLWRVRSALSAPGASRATLAWGLIGFAVWHFLDAIASHWALGIHRIRTDAGAPLLWDLGWLAAFGLLPLLVGLSLRRWRGRSSRNGAKGLGVLALITLSAGYWSAQPPPGQAYSAIVFAPDVPFDQALAAVSAFNPEIAWFNGEGVFVVKGQPRQSALGLVRRGAVFVGGAGLPPSCISWS